jgi:SM-20-related protein
LILSEVEQLGGQGFFLRAGFLGRELALAAHADAQARLERGELQRAGVRRGADHQLDAAVRGDSICWLDETATGPFHEVWRRFDELRLQLNELAWLGLRRTELQLAHYPANGAGYQRHRDAFPGDDNRRMTAIVYLNPAWEPAHGGRLTLFVEPRPLEVDPTLDTCVVFRSQLIEHEVQPSYADRFAVAAWYSAR